MIEYPELIKSKYIYVYNKVNPKKPIRINHGRKIYKYKTHYRKTIDHQDYRFGKGMYGKGGGMSIDEHVEMVNKLFPGYILDYKVYSNSIWIDYKIIRGVPASEVFPKTPEFISKVYKFCVDHYKMTAPYAHGDWILENIMVDGDDFKLIDWDHLDIYSEQEAYGRIYNDIFIENIKKQTLYK
jgi:hypothetical protein